MKNRRNYYRLLHVQPDAPLAVIKSSYTSLMLKLKQHPDLGGDHETAALINEAYAVLTNPAKRAAYDVHLAGRQSTASLGSGFLHRKSANATTSSPPGARHAPSAIARCPFCGASYQGIPGPGTGCARCDSPLTPPVPIDLEEADQRAVRRFASQGDVVLITQHSQGRTRATIEDLSPTGMCVRAGEALAIHQIVRVEGPRLRAVARVVRCRQPKPPAAVSLIGLEFVTLEFTDTRGTFVSQRT